MGANAQTTVQKFVDGAVLTAAQQNTSAATGVPVFATTVTRDAAFGGANKVLAEGQTCYLESTNVVQYYDGAAWATVGPTAGYMLVRDEKTVGTEGGTSIAGINTRVLNTVQANTITSASLAANQVTLPAGTYLINGSAPSYIGDRHRCFLYNITTSALALGGTSEYAPSTDQTQTRSFVVGRLTIAGTTVFELRHQIQSASTTFGLGIATNVAATGVEIYSVLQIVKEP